MTKVRIRPGRCRSGVIAVAAVVALGASGFLGTATARALTAPTAGINAYGGPMCADKGTSVRVTLVVKPKAGTTVIKVVDKYMQLTRVEATANAWLLHLKSPGSAIPAHTVKVVVKTATGTQTLLVAIPAFSCGPPVVVVLAGVGGPMCAADGTAVRASIAIKPKAGTAIVGVADAYMTVTNIDSTTNAWVIHLKRNAPSVPAHVAIVTVDTSTGNQLVAVPIPAFTCH
jgi:hypothetical protein